MTRTQRASVVVSFSALALPLAFGLASGQSGQSGQSKTSLINPSPAELAQRAPDSFKVLFETSKGHFTVQAFRAWAPIGVDRFYFLAKHEYFDGVRFFRVLPNFVVQFGISGDPKIAEAWETRTLPDDPVKQSNQAGMITYAMGGPNSRTTQIFINKRDNGRLDAMGFAPIAKVIDGMHVVEQLYSGYGEGGRGGPDQGQIRRQGNGYLDRQFPRLDSIVKARIVKN
jgi:peptidyl-prolyl cis-trans isomerase A (cyclophilin A)